MPALAETLCTRCGLCCDGTLFADVELSSRKEASTLEVLGLSVDDSDEENNAALLLQPCGALKKKRCSIYPYRPRCCRTFECRLLQEVKCGSVSVNHAEEQIAEALNRVRCVNRLLAQLAPPNQSLPLKERCQEALAAADEAGTAGESVLRRKCAALETAMTSLEEMIQETFLGQPQTIQRI